MNPRPTLLFTTLSLGLFSFACGDTGIGGGENGSVSGNGAGAGTSGSDTSSGSGTSGPGSGSGGAASGSGGSGGTLTGMPLSCGQAKRTETPAAPAGDVAWTPVLGLGEPLAGNGLVVDPAIPSNFYAFYQTPELNSGVGHVLKSTNFGLTWTQIDEMEVNGDAWGVAIDPNPERCKDKDPCPPPTMYKPAGYGALGVWKSVDGGATWKNLFENFDGVLPKPGGGTVAIPPDKNGITIDFYQIHILPDDPPNHILVTYHYGDVILESTDGGLTWDLHTMPGGSSHYVFGVDAKTWIAIAQQWDVPGGTYRTTTAGRIDGAVSLDAWEMVDPMLHCHGAFTPYVDPTDCSIYFAGDGGVKKTTDGGATWEEVFDSGNMCSLVGSNNALYASSLFQADSWRGNLRKSPVEWEQVGTPDWGNGVPPYAAASSYDADAKSWVMLQFGYGGDAQGEIWRREDPE